MLLKIFIAVPDRKGKFGNPICLNLGTYIDENSDFVKRVLFKIRSENPTYSINVVREESLPFTDCSGDCNLCPLISECELSHEK